MTARRQSSTTSLARFVRDEPDLNARSIDFCNSFWGPGDGGVDVLFARMRGASRTMEELRAFWRERAAIEEDYAKRLAKLSKQPLGRDEVGELRNSLDTLRLETEHQASAHAALVQSMRRELEVPASEFVAKQAHHKKTAYANIEKAFKVKQQQESIVAKAREKYKTDCVNINLYTAQSTLVQGRDLDRIHIRLDKAKQTVVQNERDYANSVAILQDTCHKWESDWKVFCDHCQDLEDERIEFMKDNVWTYANAVSTVCVSDDEACEKIRVTLEILEPEKDMESFVREYGTGANIPEPPRFHSYANGNDPPPRPGSRPSQYARSSSRSVPSRGNSLATMQAPPMPSSEEESPSPNVAGVGVAAARNPNPAPASNGAPPPRQQAPPLQNGYTGASYGSYGSSAAPPRESPPRSNTLGQTTPQPIQSRPPASTVHGGSAQALPGMATGGSFAGRAPGPQTMANEPTRQNTQPANYNSPAQTGVSSPSAVGDPEDPIAKALQALKDGNARKRTTGSIRRARGEEAGGVGSIGVSGGANLGRNGSTGASALRRAGTPNGQQDFRGTPSPNAAPGPGVARSLSRKAPAQTRDEQFEQHQQQLQQQNSGQQNDLSVLADSVVGAHPSSRPSSPQPAAPPSPRPMAAFMQPPQRMASPSFVEEYQQALPGERAENRRLSVVNTGQQNGSSRSTSPQPTTPSQQPFAGIGAHGRSPSPQPGQVSSRAPSPSPRPVSTGPGPQQQQQQQQQQQPERPSSRMQAPPSDPRQIQRAPSPSTGIAIDARGQVAHDALADDYARRNAPYQQQQQQQRGPSPQPQYQQQQTPPQQANFQPQQTGGPQRVQGYPTGGPGQQQGPYQQPPPGQGYQQQPPRGVDPRINTQVRQGSYNEPVEQQGPKPIAYGPPTMVSPIPPPLSQQMGPSHQRQGSTGPNSSPQQQPTMTGYAQQSPYQQQRPPHLQQPTGPPPQTAPPPPPQQQQPPPQQQQPFYTGHPYAQPPPGQGLYGQQQQPLQPQNTYANQQPQQQPPYQQQAPQRQQSLVAAQTGYQGGPPPQQQQPASYGYSQRPPQQQQGPPPQQQQPPQQMYQNTGYAPPQQQVQQQQYQQHQQQQQPLQRQQTLHQPVSPLQPQRTPSPRAPPTSSQGNNPGTETLEDGTPILFYVRALYDYVATIEEEFDFQSGDIIAVTATPEDGWWSGVLLDDARRIPGRTVFPSNFVCLF